MNGISLLRSLAVGAVALGPLGPFASDAILCLSWLETALAAGIDRVKRGSGIRRFFSVSFPG